MSYSPLSFSIARALKWQVGYTAHFRHGVSIRGRTCLQQQEQYALTGLGDDLGSEGRMCKWAIIA